MEHFAVEDLLDFPKDDVLMTDGFFDSFTGNSTDSSIVTAVDSCNSAMSGLEPPHFSVNLTGRSFADAQFAGNELCVPSDELAALEWLSNFVEESFSIEDVQNLHLPSGLKAPAYSLPSSSETHEPKPENLTQNMTPTLRPDVPVLSKARSKRPRTTPNDWSSRLVALSSEPKSARKPTKMTSRRRECSEDFDSSRRCLHCASEKTPQWRTGPMGPKTLCNACGVRYKSGRLVPEYRPASSPTFVSARHSNSHRKVLELRRQKEVQIAQHQQQFICQSPIFGVSDGGDYLIHHNSGSDLRRLI